MQIKDSGIAGTQIYLAELDELMNQAGFIRWAWDYNHATYDCKLEARDEVYFLRIEARAIKGKLENPDTLLELGEPRVGKHLFPHGLDYEAPIPQAISQAVDRKLALVKEKLQAQ